MKCLNTDFFPSLWWIAGCEQFYETACLVSSFVKLQPGTTEAAMLMLWGYQRRVWKEEMVKFCLKFRKTKSYGRSEQYSSPSNQPSSSPPARDVCERKAELCVCLFVCLAHCNSVCCIAVIPALLVVKYHTSARNIFPFFLLLLWSGAWQKDVVDRWDSNLFYFPVQIHKIHLPQSPMTVITNKIEGLRSLRSSKYSTQYDLSASLPPTGSHQYVFF